MADDLNHPISLPASLDNVRIESLPPAAYYISDFVSEDEERNILDKVWPWLWLDC
jgi:alkylated DNA repair protein alkB family protein 6